MGNRVAKALPLTVKARLEWQIEEIQRGIREADSGEFASDDDVSALFAKWELPTRR